MRVLAAMWAGCSGGPTATDVGITPSAVFLPDDPRDEAGATLAVGDLGAAGTPVLVIGGTGGAGHLEDARAPEDAVYVVASDWSGGDLEVVADDVLWWGSDPPMFDDLGSLVALPGDLSGDGLADLAVAGRDGPEALVWLFGGGAVGSPSDAFARITTDSRSLVACGGALGTPGALCVEALDSATVWIFAAPLAGEADPADAAVTLEGAATDLVTADLAGDGRDRLAVAHYPDVAIVDVPTGGTHAVEDVSEATLLGGGHPLTAGDLDGDGVVELVVLVDDAGTRVVELFAGPLTGELPRSAARASFDGDLDDPFVVGIAAAGDFDGDGTSDLALGAGTDRLIPGRVYVVPGPIDGGARTLADAATVLAGSGSDDEFGAALAVGDLDRDGRDDLVVGAPRDDRAGDDAGAVHLVLGGGL